MPSTLFSNHELQFEPLLWVDIELRQMCFSLTVRWWIGINPHCWVIFFWSTPFPVSQTSCLNADCWIRPSFFLRHWLLASWRRFTFDSEFRDREMSCGSTIDLRIQIPNEVEGPTIVRSSPFANFTCAFPGSTSEFRITNAG